MLKGGLRERGRASTNEEFWYWRNLCKSRNALNSNALLGWSWCLSHCAKTCPKSRETLFVLTLTFIQLLSIALIRHQHYSLFYNLFAFYGFPKCCVDISSAVKAFLKFLHSFNVCIVITSHGLSLIWSDCLNLTHSTSVTSYKLYIFLVRLTNR